MYDYKILSEWAAVNFSISVIYKMFPLKNYKKKNWKINVIKNSDEKYVN